MVTFQEVAAVTITVVVAVTWFLPPWCNSHSVTVVRPQSPTSGICGSIEWYISIREQILYNLRLTF